MSDLDGRLALVIGAAAGIGLASAQALAARGAGVILADRDGDAAEQAAGALRAGGAEAVSYRADAASLPELRGLFDFVDKRYGKLNVLFANVGMRGPDGFDVTEEQFDEVFNLNLKSHFFAANYAVPLLRRCAPQASMIFMSSAGGLRLGGRSPLYSISKAGVVMMARAFARELGPDGIRANALCPGAIETAFPRWSGLGEAEYRAAIDRVGRNVPLGRIGQPQDVAGVVTFLASDHSRYLTGLSIPVDGGELA